VGKTSGWRWERGDERRNRLTEIYKNQRLWSRVYACVRKRCTLCSVLCRFCHVDVIINMCHAVFVQKSLSVKLVNDSFKS